MIPPYREYIWWGKACFFGLYLGFLLMEHLQNLTYRKIVIFWVPLALTWLMMAFEQPFLIAFIARLGEAKFNLAAFGIAGSFAMLIEAPIIMLLSASTAIVTGRHSYYKLRRFTDILNGAITVIHLIVIVPFIFSFIVRDLMSVPEDVARLAHVALVIFLPWSASIGYRRFYQGLLIRRGRTRMVTYGTVIRFAVISVVGLTLYHTGTKGAYVGAAAMAVAVLIEAVATRLMVQKTLEEVLSHNDEENINLSFRDVSKFYTPLALTSLLSMGVHPFITFFLGRSAMAVESLAVLPVVGSLVFIFRSISLSFQEANIALIGTGRENYGILKSFAVRMGVTVTLLLALLSFTPLANLWFINVSGLTPELASIAFLPLQLLLLHPALTVINNFQRTSLIISGNTRPISTSTAIELLVIIGVLFICTVLFNMVGVVAASVAFLAGRAISTLYLVPKHAHAVKGWE